MQTAEYNYKNVGDGAILFAEEFTSGLTEENALQVITDLMADKLHDKTDKRIKRCGYCEYLYRDRTRPNNSKTCCKGCKIAFDTLNRAKLTADKELLSGKVKKKTQRELYYVSWLEYPYWLDEKKMLEYYGRKESSKDNIEQIAAAKQRAALIGGKRKNTREKAI